MSFVEKLIIGHFLILTLIFGVGVSRAIIDISLVENKNPFAGKTNIDSMLSQRRILQEEIAKLDKRIGGRTGVNMLELQKRRYLKEIKQIDQRVAQLTTPATP